MDARQITEQDILQELRDLEPVRWFEVLDFIGYLKQQDAAEKPDALATGLTAADLANSDLIGLWADRADLPDSPMFARQLRERAEHRWGEEDAAS